MPRMAILLAVIGVAFVAFCIWLTVRIINRRERWAKRTLAVVTASGAYLPAYACMVEPHAEEIHYFGRIEAGYSVSGLFPRYVHLTEQPGDGITGDETADVR